MKRVKTDGPVLTSSLPKKKKGTVSQSSAVRVRVPYSIRGVKNAFPLQLRNTLRYAETISISISAGISSYVWSCNSLYDPNTSGAGHQPYYFDQLTTIYNHYTVLKSRFRVVVYSDTSKYYTVSLFVNDDASAGISNNYAAIERPGSVTKVFNPQISEPPTLYSSWDAVKAFGPSPMANDNLQGSSAASPTETQNYHVVIYDESAANTTVKLMAYIEYDCVWDEFADTTTS